MEIQWSIYGLFFNLYNHDMRCSCRNFFRRYDENQFYSGTSRIADHHTIVTGNVNLEGINAIYEEGESKLEEVDDGITKSE